MTRIAFILSAALLLLFSGCATIVSRSAYPVQINSEPPGAWVVIADTRGDTIFEGQTPARPTLQAGGGYFRKARYIIECSHGYLPMQTRTLEFQVDPWYFGNFLIGGPLGLFLIDPLTGAMWQPVHDALLFHFGEKGNEGG